MTHRSHIALMATRTLPDAPTDADVPEWVHLLPAAGPVTTFDGRGPYRYADAQALIDASMSHKPRIVIDENHSTDIAARMGLEAPARGYIVEMQARADGIWARVDWTKSGRALLADRAYWGLSPVVAHDDGGRIGAILRATLTNNPNLRGLTALNSEEKEGAMTLQERLAELLGLTEGATDDAIVAALRAMMDGDGKDGDAPADMVAMQSQLAEIGVALGLDQGATPATILSVARAARSAGAEQSAAFVALQSEVRDLRDGARRRAAEAFADQAIRDKRAGVKAERETFIALHMESAERAEKIVGGLPRLDRTGTGVEPPAPKEGQISLNAEETAVARHLGLDPKTFAETLKTERSNQEAL